MDQDHHRDRTERRHHAEHAQPDRRQLRATPIYPAARHSPQI